MLDQKTTAVLTYLAATTQNGGYKIVEEKEALAALPKEAEVGQETFRQAVHFLAEREFIALKHEGDGEYCLTTLPKGRTLLENAGAHQPCKEKFWQNPSFWGAVVGGFVGALLGALWL